MKKVDKPLDSVKTSKPTPSQAMATQIENSHFDDSLLHQNLPQFYRSILRQFRSTTATFALFNACSFLFFAVEIGLFLSSLPMMSHSLWLAAFLSAIFLSVFCYIVLLFYFQAKKPEQFLLLKDQFIASCASVVDTKAEQAPSHQMIASALFRLSSYLEGFEWQFYPIPRALEFCRRPLSMLFAICHSQDVLRFSETLLEGSVEEHLKQICLEPTSIEAHATLATTYIALSRLYANSNTRKRKEIDEEKHQNAVQLALEELEILNHYAPNDPWVHEMLAQGYRDLGRIEEETQEIETLLHLKPQDKELLFRIGVLYFKQKRNAEGLRIYEQLKEANYKRAEELILLYTRSTLYWTKFCP